MRPHPTEPNSGISKRLQAFRFVYQVSQVTLLRGLWGTLEKNHQVRGGDRELDFEDKSWEFSFAMVGNGDVLNYNQKDQEIHSLSCFLLVNSHGGQKEAVLKYFIEIPM